MKKRTFGLGAVALVASLSLTACGDDVDSLASEYCGHIEKIKDAGDDTDKLAKATMGLSDWAEENKDAKGDADDFAKAVKEECDVDPNDPSSITGK